MQPSWNEVFNEASPISTLPRAQWVKGRSEIFFAVGVNGHIFLNSQGAPGLVPLTGHKICQIWDLQGPKTAQKQPKSAKMAI